MATVFPKRRYPSAELSVVERELIARVTVFLQEQGLSRELFRVCLENAGYKVSKASLDRWVNSVASSGYALSTDKASGARALRDEDEREIAAGWVLAPIPFNGAQRSPARTAWSVAEMRDVQVFFSAIYSFSP